MATRKSAQTQVGEYLGGVAEFLPDELSTIRSVLTCGLFLQKNEVLVNDRSRRNYHVKGWQALVSICILLRVLEHP